MIFSTNLFVFLFLPVFLLLYFVTPWRFKSYVLLAASYLFYGWWRAEYLLLVFGMSTFSFLCAKLAVAASTVERRRAAMIIGVAGDLAILGYFKYFNFFIGTVNEILTSSDMSALTLPAVLLPIGISFHTFQSISYVIDVWRGDALPARRLVDFLAFGALFPQLIAGPVLRYKDLADQFIERTHSLEKFTRGVYRFIQGLAMKVLIADSISPLADRMFSLPSPTMSEAWLGAFAYTFQLFFDFAGYSAMAIGLGLMIGFEFIENFNKPYISRSITEFWQRWHISLSTWLRDYLYISMGGNRRGARRTYFNLMVTMVLGGFWHGANWTFLFWGVWHGGIMAIERAMGSKGRGTVWPRAIALPLTFVLVVIGWVMFRSSSLESAFSIYGGMLGLNGFSITPGSLWQIRNSELVLLSLAAVLAFWPVLAGLHRAEFAPRMQSNWSPAARALAYSLIGALAMMRMASQTFSPFLYFQF